MPQEKKPITAAKIDIEGKRTKMSFMENEKQRIDKGRFNDIIGRTRQIKDSIGPREIGIFVLMVGFMIGLQLIKDKKIEQQQDSAFNKKDSVNQERPLLGKLLDPLKAILA
jgi:hypothetical protein